MAEQKEAMPKTEDFILDVVEEHRMLVLNFVEYLKSNRMSLSDNKIKYKGKCVGVLSNNKKIAHRHQLHQLDPRRVCGFDYKKPYLQILTRHDENS